MGKRQFLGDNVMKRTIAVLSVLLALLVSTTTSMAADNFPSRPVRIIVPVPPGGPLDISARLIARDLQQLLGQAVIIENRSGAAGNIGADYVAKSVPDGYTLLLAASSALINSAHLQKLPYDLLKDLVGVSQTGVLVFVLVVNPKTGITSVASLVAKAKASPGRLTFGSGGSGSGQHLFMELLKSAAGINLTHVPYKGGAPALQAVVAGEVDMDFEVSSTVIPIVKSGKATALMVTGAKSLELFPGAVPFDSLYPGFDIQGWQGVFAPAGTPGPIVEKLGRDIRQVVLSPGISTRFRELGVEPSGLYGEKFGETIRRDFERWGDLIRKNNIRAD